MGGTCRPDSNIYKCGKEMTSYTLVKGYTRDGNGSGLIDQSAPNNWQGNTVAYWDSDYDEYYVIFKFDRPCYIWRSGTDSWPHYISTLKITNLDTGKVVTDEVTIANATQLRCNEWEKIYYIKEPGTYEFRLLENWRLDSEWFFEEASNESQIIKNKVKDTILNNELFKKYCIPIEEE